MIRRLAGSGLFLVLMCSCAGFIPESKPAPEAQEGDVVLGLGNLEEKQTIQVKGTLADRVFVTDRIEIEDPDDEVEIKGELTEPLQLGGGAVGGVSVKWDAESALVDSSPEDLPAGLWPVGSWVKAECVARPDGLYLRKITRRVRDDLEPATLRAAIDELDLARLHLVIGSVPIQFDSQSLVVWDADAPPPNRQDARAGRVTDLRRVRVLDDENWRPDPAFRIGDWLSVGGEFQVDGEYRNNHDLRDNRERDRLLWDTSAKLEFTLRPSRHLLGFAAIDFSYEFVHFDQDNDIELGDEFRIDEAWVLLEDLPVPGLSLQLGRQDFDHGREWLMDDQIDGARAWINLAAAVMELSVSRALFDTDPEEDGVTNFLAGLHAHLFRDGEIFFYGLHRDGGTLVDLSRTHVGMSARGGLGDLSWWLDVGHAFGKEGSQSFSGWGVDVMTLVVLKDAPLEPSLYAGFAWGSGNADGDSTSDRSFRQSGIQDNADRLNGVASFRYLGEVLRPELSNLFVYTAGVGFRLGDRTSIDLVWHHYRQDDAATFLRDTRLRLNPTGDSKDVGNAYEVIIGFEDFRPWEVTFVFGWFEPGSAFGSEHDAAMFATLEVQWSF